MFINWLVGSYFLFALLHKVNTLTVNSGFQSKIAGDCIQQCILPFLLTDLWILRMLEEDNGTLVTSCNHSYLISISCATKLLNGDKGVDMRTQ
jgi:hypothetical protein